MLRLLLCLLHSQLWVRLLLGLWPLLGVLGMLLVPLGCRKCGPRPPVRVGAGALHVETWQWKLMDSVDRNNDSLHSLAQSSRDTRGHLGSLPPHPVGHLAQTQPSPTPNHAPCPRPAAAA